MLQQVKHAMAWFMKKATETYAWNPNLIDHHNTQH